MPVLRAFQGSHAEKRLPQRDVTRKRGNTVSACGDGGTSFCKGDATGLVIKATGRKGLILRNERQSDSRAGFQPAFAAGSRLLQSGAVWLLLFCGRADLGAKLLALPGSSTGWMSLFTSTVIGGNAARFSTLRALQGEARRLRFNRPVANRVGRPDCRRAAVAGCHGAWQAACRCAR